MIGTLRGARTQEKTKLSRLAQAEPAGSSN